MTPTGSRQAMRRFLGDPSVGVMVVVWAGWLLVTFIGGRWDEVLLQWPMMLTMALGSFVAGATSEGGGAVAFPVLTLGFQVLPSDARDFGFLIQSVGMTAASLVIWARKIPVHYRAIVWVVPSSLLGLWVGLTQLSFSPAVTKMFFVTLWLSFGVVLYRARLHEGTSPAKVVPPAWSLVIAGVLGGAVSAQVGTGADVLTFALLVLRYGTDVRVATPTSVVIMAMVSVLGAMMRMYLGPPVASLVWSMWWACVPIVVVGAPLGARFIARQGHRVIIVFLCVSLVLQFGWAALLIEQTFQTVVTVILTALIGFAGFFWLSKGPVKAVKPISP